MKLGRCPVCHSHIQLEALIQDDAGSELLGLLSGLGRPLARPLVTYLGLFRPAKSNLSNARALRLAQEVLALGDRDTLTAALNSTNQSLHEKRLNGQVKPLKNHNYLRQVMGSVAPEKSVPEVNGRPRFEEKKQGMEESPEETQRKWEEQMARLGVDTSKYKTRKKPGE